MLVRAPRPLCLARDLHAAPPGREDPHLARHARGRAEAGHGAVRRHEGLAGAPGRPRSRGRAAHARSGAGRDDGGGAPLRGHREPGARRRGHGHLRRAGGPREPRGARRPTPRCGCTRRCSALARDLRRAEGVDVQIRVGLNSGEVVVRAIGSDLHMDYSAVGQTTYLAAQMERLARPGSTLLAPETRRLTEGFLAVTALGPVPIKGVTEPVEVYELTGAGPARYRLQAAAVRGLSRFVGREAEVERLREAFARSCAGEGRLVALVGEPGVGKSRVIREFVEGPWMEGAILLEGRPVVVPEDAVVDAGDGRAAPLLPDRPARRGADHPGEDHRQAPGARSRARARAAGPPRARRSRARGRARGARWTRRSAGAGSRRRCATCCWPRAGAQPVVFVVEDLQRIDEETQALLDNLVDRLQGARLLILVAYRPEYQHQWGSKPGYTQIRIDPLPAGDGRARCSRACSAPIPSLAALKAVLVERTDGNPLFLEESVRALVETQALIGEPGARRLAKPLETVQVPGSVQAVLAARIDRLTPGGQARAPVGLGDRQGRAVPGAGRDRRSARRGSARRARAAAVGRAALRGQLLPRDRVHVQARPDPRGGLRQPAPRDAARAARAHRGRHRAALRRAPGRARGAAGPPRPAGRPARAGGGLSAPGRGQGGRPLGAPRGGGLLRAGARDPRGRRPARARPRDRAWIWSSTCAPRSRRSASSPGRSTTCAGPRRRPRRSATGGASAGSRRISPSRTTPSASRPRPSARPSARSRSAGRCRDDALQIVARRSGSARPTTCSATIAAAQRHLGRGGGRGGGRR